MIRNKSHKKPNLSNITQKWVNMLLPFSADYSCRFSASDLARISKVPQQTASRCLNELVKLNLIDYKKEGRNKLFYFDLRKHTSIIILNIIECHKAMLFQLKMKEISVIINEILKNCESLAVFGSYAYGNFSKDSDLDMVILGKFDKEQIKKIKQKQIIEINEHYASYSDFKKILASKNPLAIEIMKNHILFGDISRITNIFMESANG